jgi:hypothetical protein
MGLKIKKWAATTALLAFGSVLTVAVQPVLAAPVALTNGGFEQSWTSQSFIGTDGSAIFYYTPTGPGMGWTFNTGLFGGGGVSNSYSLLSAYEGNRFGLLQLGNASDPFGSTNSSNFSQSFNLAASSDVEVSFAMALRPGYAGGQHVLVAVDGNVLADLAVTQTSWSLQNVNLGALSAGNHTLAFAGIANFQVTGDTTAFIDDVQLNTVAPTGGNGGNVPEPGSLALVALALGTVRLVRRKNK